MRHRPNIVAIAMAVAMGLLVAGIALSAERSVSPGVSHTLLKAGASQGSHPTRAACIAERDRLRLAEAAAKTSGQVRWVCREDDAVTVTYGLTSTTPPPAPVNCVVSAWSAWSAPAWSACANGQQSRTETRTRTVTTQPANGGTACPALSESRTVTQPCSAPGSANLSWTRPTHNINDTALTDLAGYRIHYGRTAGALTQTIQVPSATRLTYTVDGLAAGTWHFAVRAYTTDGRESELSNIRSKVIP